MREIRILVGNAVLGRQRTWGYPKGAQNELFWIPIYPCTVAGTDEHGQSVSKRLNVLRFGIHNPDGRSPRVVGLADQQRYIIKNWLPTYRVHSAPSQEDGAWHVKDNFLIHDGPDDPTEIYATIGCIEIMGLQGFVRFNDLIISLSGLSDSSASRNNKLGQIGRSGKLSITYQRATRPALERV